jgi:hypothetical protein
MTMATAALLVGGVGVVLAYRASRAIASWPVAALSVAALVAGQLLMARPSMTEALVFAAAALAIERSVAARGARPRLALGMLAVPALIAFAMRPGLPTAASSADVLFCSQHGALATSAVLWLGLVGLGWGAVGDRRVAFIAASFGLAVAAIAGGHDPAATWREAIGRFSAALPHTAIGVAAFAARLTTLTAARPGWAAALALTPLIVWNVTLMAVAQAGTLRIGEAVSFGTIGAAQARTLHGWIGHPFSMPANAAFAIRHGVSPSRFDEIGVADYDPARPLSIDIGGADQPMVGAGWFAPERAADLSFRWAGQRAEILLPPLPAGPVRLRLRIYAFSYPSAPQQRVQLQIADALAGPATVGSDWSWIELSIDLARPTSPGTPMILAFTRATPPSAVQASKDGRPLSAAVDMIEIVPVR